MRVLAGLLMTFGGLAWFAWAFITHQPTGIKVWAGVTTVSGLLLLYGASGTSSPTLDDDSDDCCDILGIFSFWDD